MNVKSGMKFGKVTAIARDGASRHRKATWRCRCDCGKTMVGVVAGNLVSGRSKSCGCVGVEKTVKRNKESAKHGMGGTPEYSVWYGLVSRCVDEKDVSYNNYGARGIKVCEFIASSPLNLYSIVGPRPKFEKPRHYSIDRKNNDGNYSCGQCSQCSKNGWKMNLRWFTQKEQRRNTRHNHVVEIGGIKKCIAEWAEFAGLKYSVVWTRISLGWPKEKLLIPCTK